MILLLVVQVSLGLLTIIPALNHLDGGVMIQLAHWAQAVVFFQAALPVTSLALALSTSCTFWSA